MWKVEIKRPDGTAGELHVVGAPETEEAVREHVRAVYPELTIVLVARVTPESAFAPAEAQPKRKRKTDEAADEV